jgi:hypothetical protein
MNRYSSFLLAGSCFKAKGLTDIEGVHRRQPQGRGARVDPERYRLVHLIPNEE